MKKILALCLILIAVFSCLSVVSAGLFDFGSDSSTPADSNDTVIDINMGNITYSSVTYTESIVQQAGNSFMIGPDGSIDTTGSTKVDVTTSYYVEIDISGLNGTDRESLESAVANNYTNVDFVLANNKTASVSVELSIDGDTLTMQGNQTEYNVYSDGSEDTTVVSCSFPKGTYKFIAKA